MIEQATPGNDLEVDEEIDSETAPLVIAAGANVLVGGSAVFGESQGVTAAIGGLLAAVNQVGNLS